MGWGGRGKWDKESKKEDLFVFILSICYKFLHGFGSRLGPRLVQPGLSASAEGGATGGWPCYQCYLPNSHRIPKECHNEIIHEAICFPPLSFGDRVYCSWFCITVLLFPPLTLSCKIVLKPGAAGEGERRSMCRHLESGFLATVTSSKISQLLCSLNFHSNVENSK